MKLIYRVLFVAFLLAQLPFLAAQEAANPDSRAEELRERRRQKGQQLVPPKTSGLEKAFIKMESGEIVRQIKAIRWKDFYPKFGQISNNSGMAGGVRYYKRTGLGLAVEGSAAISFTSYRQAEFHFGRFNQMAPNTLLGPNAFGAPFDFGDERPGKVKSYLYLDLRYRYYPQERFYGVGASSSLEDRTNYLLEDGHYGAAAGYQFGRWVGVGARGAYLKVNTGPGTDDAFPVIGDLFDDSTAPGLARQPDFLRFDSVIFVNLMDTPGNPHKGAAVGLAYSRFDARGGDDFDFDSLVLDARGYLPLGSRQRVLAVRFLASRDNADSGSRVPFYLMRTLGGKETLRGFADLRFRDAKLLYLSAEYRWEAAPAIEGVFFYDTGRVFPESNVLKFKHLEHNIGAGIRFKALNRVILRLDVGRGREGTLVHFQFGPSF
jgi:hypothetical protein